MAKIIMINWFSRKIVKENKNIFFVFGDNLVKKGKGGQAVIRGLKNTIGVPTKKYPSNRSNSYMSDDELNSNKEAINQAFVKINEKIKEGYFIALPKDGLGTGLAKLKEKAPKTNEYLLNKIEKLKKDHGVINS